MADPRDKGFQDYYRDKAKTQAASGYRPDRDRRHPKQPNILDRISNKAQVVHGLNPLPYAYEKAKEYFPGSLGIAQRGVDAVLRNRKMHGENVDYFGGNWLNTRIPNRVKESLMTTRDEDFYDKYMRLAELTSDPDKRAEYIDTANTARQNMQITGRLNYGLGQVDPEGTYTNREGLPSYSQDLFGEGFNRFNLERFKEAMGMGEGVLGALPEADRHPDVFQNYVDNTLGLPPSGAVDVTGDPTTALLPSYMQEDEGIFGDIPVTEDLSPRDKFNPRIPPWAQGDRDMTTTETDLATDPRPWLRDEIEDPLLGIDEKFFDDEPNLEVDLQLPYTPPFDDSGREAGIAALYGQGPMWGETDRRYEDEYRDHIERTGERMTYEEFERAWERLHALPRGLHYGETYQSPFGS